MFYSRYALTALKLGFQLACISDIYESVWKKKVIRHFLGKKSIPTNILQKLFRHFKLQITAKEESLKEPLYSM